MFSFEYRAPVFTQIGPDFRLREMPPYNMDEVNLKCQMFIFQFAIIFEMK